MLRLLLPTRSTSSVHATVRRVANKPQYLPGIRRGYSSATTPPPSLDQSSEATPTEQPEQPKSKSNRSWVIGGATALGFSAVIAANALIHDQDILLDTVDNRVRDQASAAGIGAPGRPRLVILGTGWGAVSTLKSLDIGAYDVTVVSPTNYFLFTPLLPSTTVGTLEVRSLLEPIRSICRRRKARFLQAEAQAVDLDAHEVVIRDDAGRDYHLPYDLLIVAVGSQSATYGIPGLEHCNLLKTVQDARNARARIIDCFERASLPTTTPREKERLLSFVICGGGPTGVEFAAELYDFLTDDLERYFPNIRKTDVRVRIIQSGDHVLNTYDQSISDYTEAHFARANIDVITQTRVISVAEDHIVYRAKPTKDVPNPEPRELPFGLCMWTTGIAMRPFTQRLKETLGPIQRNARALETDNRLRVLGIPDGSVYALGDCSTIDNPSLSERLIEEFNAADTNHDGILDYSEFALLGKSLMEKYPHTRVHLQMAKKVFEDYDADHTGNIDLEELRLLLRDIDARTTSLPATAQVASQQGKYLATKLNAMAKHDAPADPESRPDDLLPPFGYSHLGSLAYVGGTAVADFGGGYNVMGGLSAKYLWRGIYWSEQVSFRTRALLAIDWTKEIFFGRDSSRF